MKFNVLGLLITLLFFLYSCSDDNPTIESPPIDSEIITSLTANLNPTGYAPLTALLNLETKENIGVEITVVGKQGAASSITKRFSQRGTNFELDILGLYADFENTVQVKILDASNSIIETQELKNQTAPLIADMPNISIDVPSNASELEFNFVNYFGFNQNFRPQRPFIFDQFGDIR